MPSIFANLCLETISSGAVRSSTVRAVSNAPPGGTFHDASIGPTILEPPSGDCQRHRPFAASMHPGICHRLASRFAGSGEHPVNRDEKRLETPAVTRGSHHSNLWRYSGVQARTGSTENERLRPNRTEVN